MDTITTLTKVVTAYGCSGKTFHVVSGIALIREGRGYHCPYCNSEVYDISDTEVGKAYIALTRVDLNHPAPLRTVQ